ncbi:serine/threonine-protein kinase [Chondromyces apiculatus]|uniref:Protein kinase domain-containing protein n=1 Tax=Chondromyces apiculatus DSM 436 TaxID=1192034 RepID=A0A017THV2_9BACT|nr:serine/threonine-protein kinase [Chondromyces apiculatus]EYF08415.1 Hypothetical protein CAP_3944 [Chondromyces apiculatus DSM 436]
MSLPITPGTIVGGKYRLTKPLGSGAMGAVWAAVNENTGREVAVKLLTDTDDSLRKRLVREARVYGQLSHPNIVEIIDLGFTDDDEPFLVMELLHGETLAQRLRRERRLDPHEAARIARDIARGLAAAHAKQIIHRDLKPANIFLQTRDDGFQVKVLDFGVGKNLAASDGLHTVAGATLGTLAYMSPEQARGESNVDPRTDLWPVGVLLAEMLTGERPLRGLPAPQLIMMVSRGDLPPVSELAPDASPALQAIIARCLKADRSARIGSALELAAQLDPLTRPAASQPPADEDVDDDAADALLQEAATIKLQPHMVPALLKKAALQALSGTVRMPSQPSRPSPPAVGDESTTLPKGTPSPAPSLPSGPGGTELMLPLPTSRPPAGPPPAPSAPDHRTSGSDWQRPGAPISSQPPSPSLPDHRTSGSAWPSASSPRASMPSTASAPDFQISGSAWPSAPDLQGSGSAWPSAPQPPDPSGASPGAASSSTDSLPMPQQTRAGFPALMLLALLAASLTAGTAILGYILTQ